MARGPLFQSGYKPQFSGHQTFPLRYGWLKKAFDAVYASERSPSKKNAPDNKAIFLGDEAIARFGVGKNMVSSMRHWATAAGIIEDASRSKSICTTKIGRKIFGPRGLDPYMEHPATLWLTHWQLSGRPESGKTTLFWAFNYYAMATFTREEMEKNIKNLAKDLHWSRAARATIKNDVACFIGTYVAQQTAEPTEHEDILESPLTELGLIKATGRSSSFHFVRGPKSTLGNGVFIYALIDFWLRFSKTTATLPFEAIVHEPGAPGRVFLLDENDIVDRLAALDEVTNGGFRWSETAGLKQVVRNCDMNSDIALQFPDLDYGRTPRQEAA